jgi:hypothetical protein
MRRAIAALSVGVFTVLSAPASATVVPVANPSFELPPLATLFVIGAPTGWTTTGVAGYWEPNLPSFFSGPLPDGVQAAFIGDGGNTGSLSQTLTEVLTAGSNYLLELEVGLRNDFPLPGNYTIELLAGTTVIASLDQSQISLTTGGFVPVALSYITVDGDPLLGQALGIRFTGGAAGGQIHFDDVRVTASEPGALAILGAGLAGLALVRRKRA